MEYKSHFVPLKHGRHLHLLRSGSTPALPWILLHGYGEGAYVWNEVFLGRPQTFPVIAVDLAGHGRSCRSLNSTYTTLEAVEDIKEVVAQMCLDQFGLIGHSWGGIIALHIAAQLSDSVKGLVVVDCGIEDDDEGKEYVREELNRSLRLYQTVDEYAAWLADRRPLVSLANIRRLANDSLCLRADGRFELRLDPALGDAMPPKSHNIREILRTIQAPVLLVRGAISGIFSLEMAGETARALKRCKFHSVPKAGHSVMSDNPQGFISAIVPFMQDISTCIDHQQPRSLLQ